MITMITTMYRVLCSTKPTFIASRTWLYSMYALVAPRATPPSGSAMA